MTPEQKEALDALKEWRLAWPKPADRMLGIDQPLARAADALLASERVRRNDTLDGAGIVVADGTWVIILPTKLRDTIRDLLNREGVKP